MFVDHMHVYMITLQIITLNFQGLMSIYYFNFSSSLLSVTRIKHSGQKQLKGRKLPGHRQSLTKVGAVTQSRNHEGRLILS